MAKSNKQTFVLGAFILMLSNIVVKIIGAIFKIPLDRIIRSEGMAFFSAAYTIYVSFYQISTAGIPVAVSRMIAASNTRGNTKEVRRIFDIALKLFLVIGVLGTTIMIAFSRAFASGAGEGLEKAYYAIIAIAPTLFFVCVVSAYRGYFQGLQNMVPSAVSQVFESLGKLVFGLFAAVLFTYIFKLPPYHVAALVIAGVSIGECASMIYLFFVKRRHNRSKAYIEATMAMDPSMPTRSSTDLLKELVLASLPIAIASSVMGLTNTVDTFTMANGLVHTGITAKAATQFFGVYSGKVVTLFNLTPPFIYPFAISLIPALSSGIEKHQVKTCRRHIDSALRLAAVIAVPCAIGMGCMSRGILHLLFTDEAIALDEAGLRTVSAIDDLAAPALSVVACGIFFLGIIAITNSILQAFKLERYTIVSTSVGILFKIALTYFLSMIPNFGVLGSAIGTASGYFVMMALNVFFVISKTGYIPRVGKIYLKPLAAGVLCGIAAILVNGICGGAGAVATILAIMAAGVVYVASLLLLKGLYKEDVLSLPAGGKICAILERFRLLNR